MRDCHAALAMTGGYAFVIARSETPKQSLIKRKAIAKISYGKNKSSESFKKFFNSCCAR